MSRDLGRAWCGEAMPTAWRTSRRRPGARGNRRLPAAACLRSRRSLPSQGRCQLRRRDACSTIRCVEPRAAAAVAFCSPSSITRVVRRDGNQGRVSRNTDGPRVVSVRVPIRDRGSPSNARLRNCPSRCRAGAVPRLSNRALRPTVRVTRGSGPAPCRLAPQEMRS